MKTVYTQEQMNNMTLLAAMIQQANPKIEPYDISVGLVKLQKLASTLRGRDGTAIANEMARMDYNATTKKHQDKFITVAKTLGLDPETIVTDQQGLICFAVRASDVKQRIW